MRMHPNAVAILRIVCYPMIFLLKTYKIHVLPNHWENEVLQDRESDA